MPSILQGIPYHTGHNCSIFGKLENISRSCFQEKYHHRWGSTATHSKALSGWIGRTITEELFQSQQPMVQPGLGKFEFRRPPECHSRRSFLTGAT